MLICVGILVCVFAGFHGWVFFRGMNWLQKINFLPIPERLVFAIPMIILDALLRIFCMIMLFTWPLTFLNLTFFVVIFPILQEPYSVFHAYFQNYKILWMFSALISFGHFAGTLYFWRQKT